MTKRKCLSTVLVLVLTALIAVSCSPIPEKKAIARVEVDPADIRMEADPGSETEIRVSFPPVRGATGYELKLTEKESGDTRSLKIDKTKNWKDGMLMASFGSLRPETEYSVTLSVTGKDPEEKFEIEKKGLKTLPSLTELNETKPVVWLENIENVSGGEFSANIRITRQKGYVYRLTVLPDPESSDPADNPFIIKDDPAKKLISTGERKLTSRAVIKIEHGKDRGNGEIIWGASPTTITFPENIAMYDTALRVKYEGGMLKWEGASPASGSISLWRHTLSGTSHEKTFENTAADGSVPWNDPHSLESALYFITDGSHVSNPFYNTAGLNIETEVTQQTVTMRWKEPEGVSVAYSGIEQPVEEDGWMVSRETGLESRTPFSFTVKAIFRNGTAVEETVEGMTESFEGKYAWTDTSGATTKNAVNFVVNVVDAPEDSENRYYVYTDPSDRKCIDDGDTTPYRLMPLYDTAAGEKIPEGDISFSDLSTPQTRAYRWNESKWNSSNAHPTSWTVKDSIIDGDRTTSKVETTARIAILKVVVVTQTDIEFFVNDEGEPMMRFRNKAVSGPTGIVNDQLNKNQCPREAYGEDEFTYALSRIGQADVPEEV